MSNECKHDIVFKGMCGSCGIDLRNRNMSSGESSQMPTANVSMVHHVPELVVSADLANELGEKDHQQVLKARKLILLVDLDQTLIHTTNRPLGSNEQRPDIFQFRCQDGLYSTKLRPRTREFLNEMNKLYEMHIISFGQRYYAHQIANILDPDKRFFAQRIMSRDEISSFRHKTNNINALFPNPDHRKLIVIIDDRDDVWKYSESLIRIRPYKFFSEVDDINAPPTAPRGSVKAAASSDAASDPSQAEVEHREVTPPAASQDLDHDTDEVLEDIGKVLKEVHRAFFEHYDRTKEVTDVSGIVSYMRKQVLKDEVICLSGIIPHGQPRDRALIYRLCEQFGAKIVDHLDDHTTVLIAAKPSTEKVRQALKKNIPVVTPEWILTCSAQWFRAEKADFGHHGLDPKHFRERREEGNQSPKLSDLEPLSKSEMKEMTDEIDAELGETSSESGDDERGSDTEGEPEVEIAQPAPEVKKVPKETALEEVDSEVNKRLLVKLKAGEGDSDDEEQDERLRNGDIDSRKRKRRSESPDDDDDTIEPKRFAEDNGSEASDDDDDDDDSDDEMAAAIESRL